MPLPETPSPVTPVSRRELNKVATRDAIAGAALDFLRARSFNEFTVDDVAAAAGVSRRTFFNYFPSVEAAVASFTQRYLDGVIEEMETRPVDEPILKSAEYALSASGHSRELAALAETCALTQDPSLGRFQLQAWEACSAKITAVARHRLPAGTDELYINALVGAVVGGGRAALLVWLNERGSDTSAESVARLRDLLGAAVAHVRNGFRS
ncbi:TetR family transcriptional regulator [Arthrobacter dokdonensis]|uniref:TetR family transcriptional regulator n=1 Tax=Arthrobacter dokdonellae TaxID=2211210 RepID=UPI000DE595FF|nr:TetR family transcriptional regulator [Arthrobacter dokdonellae]